MTRRATAVLLIMVLGGSLFAAPALAAQAEPSIIANAWYWETQQNQSVDTPVGVVSGEAPNPFCPAAPGGLGGVPGTCAEGRLPVEVVQGDYEAPDKVSAVGFDFSMVTTGSKVSKFTVAMLEAESGCTPDDNSPSGQKCEETDARNPEGKLIQACEVTEIFGDGAAREYSEMPKFDCAGAATAERKEVKNNAKDDPNDPDADHVWTFDLTDLAKKWAASAPLCTCVMFRPKAPKNAEDDSPAWRVVFAGPSYPDGVKTNLVFTPGEEGLPPITPITPIGGGTSTGTTSPTSSFGSTSVGGGLDSGSSDVGTTDSSAPAGDDAAAPEEVAPGEDAELAGAEGPEIESMPGYVWLALLAGLIGFSMVRSIILENAHAHRANGVLAHIHRINAQRGGMQGAEAAAAVAGPLSGLKTGLATIGSSLKPVTGKISSLIGKIPGIKKG